MNAREEEFASKLKGYLDQGSADLRPGIAFRLQQARAAALARARGEPLPQQDFGLAGAHGLAGAGGGSLAGSSRPNRPLYTQFRLWLAVGLVAAAVLGYQQWTAWQELLEQEDLDTQILTSDLPIDAFVDRGFQLWLKSAQPD